jgi:hypothetical protein
MRRFCYTRPMIPLRKAVRGFAKVAGNVASRTGVAYVRDGGWHDVPPGMNGLDYMNLWTGRYEQPEREILKHFRHDSTIIELGSNIGIIGRHAFETKLNAGGKMVFVAQNQYR